MIFRPISHHRLTITALLLFFCATIPRTLSAQTDTTDLHLTLTLPARNISHDGATLCGRLLSADTAIYEVGFICHANGKAVPVVVVKDPASNEFYGAVSGLAQKTEVIFRTYAKHRTLGISYGSPSQFITDAIVQEVQEEPATTVANIKINTHVARHRTSFGYTIAGFLNINNITGQKRRLINACDYRNETVRGKALKIASQSPGSFNLSQICDIFDYCNSNWKYVNDPAAREIYQKASFSIINELSGDCDDFAILVCSMLLSIGGDARINFASQKNNSAGHAFTEINLGKADMTKVADYIAARYKANWTGNIHYRIDRQKNCWLNMDWWAKHPGGPYYKADRGTRFYILDDYCEDY